MSFGRDNLTKHMIFGMMDEFEDDKNKEDAAGEL